MQVIQEMRDSNGAIYFVRIYKDAQNKILGKEDIRFPTYTREQPDGFSAIIMYTHDMQPIVDAFIFLNQRNEPYSTRRKAAPALRLLYTYESIISKKLADFTVADIEAFKDFLSGTSYSGSDMQINLIESRDNGTVNAYLGIYRKYCDYIGIENAVLNRKTVRASDMVTGTFSDDNAPYKHNRRIAKQHEVPRYISPEEFNRIIKVIRSDYTKREEAIVRLMYENGLRIGEVLGLTNDDIVEEKIDSVGWVNVLYLRNRCSDNQISQSSKGRMQPRYSADYMRRDYNLYGYGYHKVSISHSLADLIFAYIEEAHLEARARYSKEYWNRVAADRVRNTEKHEEPNFYVFLNSCGRSLLQSARNKTKVINVIALLLPNPSNLIPCSLPVGTTEGDNGEFLGQVISIDHTKNCDSVGGGSVLPTRSDIHSFAGHTILKNVLDIRNEYLICITQSLHKEHSYATALTPFTISLF